MPVRSGRDATLNFDKIAAVVPVYVSVLPSQPIDGQEVYFQTTAMAAAGQIWHLRYRAASPFASKWEFIGGTEAGGEILGDVTTASAASVPLTGGPTFTLPLNGRYLIGMEIRIIAGAAPGYAIATVFHGVVETPVSLANIMNASGDITLAAQRALVDASLGEVVTIKVSCANSTSNRFLNGCLNITPRFVG